MTSQSNLTLQSQIDRIDITPLRANQVTTGHLTITHYKDGSICREVKHDIWPTYCFDGQPLLNALAQLSYNLFLAEQIRFMPREKAKS